MIRMAELLIRLDAWRRARGLARTELATRAGMQRKALQRMGKPEWNPTASTLDKVLAVVPDRDLAAIVLPPPDRRVATDGARGTP